ncbi:MAG: PfkB family carbohydrate kinase [Myxococcota bacterium]
MTEPPADLASRPLDVVGIGSMVVDRVHRAAALAGADAKSLLAPLASGAVVERCVGGVVLNHLGWAAAMGVRCGVFGRQGDDDDGRFLRAAMDARGIARDIALVADATSLAEIFVDAAGARAIYMAPGATAATTAADVRARHAAFVARARRVATEVSQLPLAAALEAFALAREHGCETWLDLDVPPAQARATLGSEAELDALLRRADVLKPSKSAALELAGVDARAPALDVARRLRDRYAARLVAITDGERGCAIATADGLEIAVAAARLPDGARVVDTTGAGDAFLGGLLAASCAGLGAEDAARFGNACGAVCAAQLGAFPLDAAGARAAALAVFEGSARARDALAALADDAHAAGARSDDAHDRGDPAADAQRDGARADDARGAAALRVLDAARGALAALRARARGGDFARAADAIAAGGRCHATGVGKPGHVARYAAALLSSTGTPAAALDPLEALHGSLGQLAPGDALVAISQSGETDELVELAARAAARGVRIVAVTGDPASRLARLAEAVLETAVAEEGGPLGLAPRASVAAEVAVVAALAAELQERAGQTRAEYAELHPAGALGARARAPSGASERAGAPTGARGAVDAHEAET